MSEIATNYTIDYENEHGQEWRVVVDGERLGTFYTKADAVTFIAQRWFWQEMAGAMAYAENQYAPDTLKPARCAWISPGTLQRLKQIMAGCEDGAREVRAS